MLDEVRRLRSELAASPSQAAPRVAENELTTVRVPPGFEDIFLEAQRNVARYFEDRIERPERATISIAGERYILLRAASMSVEFIELVTSLYRDAGSPEAFRVAHDLLFDLAHAIGKADALAFQQKMNLRDPIAALSAGPVHFAFSGWAFVDIDPASSPTPDRDFVLVYEHPFSFESHSWLAKARQSDAPVCVMNAGYSSGWCEESFGLPLVSAEVECVAAGGRRCRFVMAPPGRIEDRIAELAGEAEANGASILSPRFAVQIPEFFQRKRLEEQLRRANEDLERRVQERTSELRMAYQQLEHQAFHDPLTDLPNRILLLDRLDQALLASRRTGDKLALFYMDLDGFKEVNDRHGHHVGDLLLKKMAPRIRGALRATDTVARFGGDEFAILLPMIGTPEKAIEVARKVLDGLARPFEIEGMELQIGASLGVVICPEHGRDADALLRHADSAMYAAKASRSGIRLFDAS